MWKTCLGLNGFVSSEKVHGLSFQLGEILAHAREVGYDGIELRPFHEPYPATVVGQRALRALYQRYGLETPALQTAARGHAASPERKLRDAYVESVRDMLDFAHVLQASEVGIWSGGPLHDVPHDEQMRFLLETCQRCAALAEQARITLALEPEPVQVVSSLDDMVYLLDGVPSPAFTSLFDFSHANVMSGGQPLDFLRALKGRIGHVHVTDNNGQCLMSDVAGASHSSYHQAVGDGTMNLDALVADLRRTGYTGWFQVDVWENPDPYRASRLGKKYLDGLT